MFAVMHKETKKFFAGFSGNRATWTADRSKAKAYPTARLARGQALCFLSNDVNVQQKPVRI